jgi:hypothetical protein
MMERRGRVRQERVCLSMFCVTGKIFPFQFRQNRWHFDTVTFTQHCTRKDLVISPYVLSLRGLPLPPTCVFVTVKSRLRVMLRPLARNMLAKKTIQAEVLITAVVMDADSIRSFIAWALCNIDGLPSSVLYSYEEVCYKVLCMNPLCCA